MSKVAIEAHTWQVTDLIVEKAFLQKKDRVIPVEAIVEVDNYRISLSIDHQELAYFPEYLEKDFVIPTSCNIPGAAYVLGEALEWIVGSTALFGLDRRGSRQPLGQSTAHDRIILGRGTRVYGVSKTFGCIDDLLLNTANGEIVLKRLIVRKGRLLPYWIIIPRSMVRGINDKGVYIPASYEEL